MSMTYEVVGGILIGAAAIWVVPAVRALIVTRGATAAPKRGYRRRQWQRLALGGYEFAIGVWDISGPSQHPAVLWWLIPVCCVLAVWMLITDIGPWLRSRLTAGSHTQT